MKRIMFIYYTVATLVAIAVAVLFDVKTWAGLIKGLICAYMAASIIILVGEEFKWSFVKTVALIIPVAAYARPCIYGFNKLIKEFFADPKAFIEKYKGLRE